ncbi:hypothetical protein L195_g029107, partial [Trifolium pratense]
MSLQLQQQQQQHHSTLNLITLLTGGITSPTESQ